MILTPLHKLPKNVEDLGKLFVGKGFKKLPKVQQIAQSGHIAFNRQKYFYFFLRPERGGLLIDFL